MPHQDYYRALQQEQLLEKVVFNLSDACAEPSSLSDLFGQISENETAPDFFQKKIRYAPSQGAQETREAISKFHAHADPEYYVTFSGAQEAIYCAMAALLEPGDEVITCTPAYPPLLHTPRVFGSQTKQISLAPENNWKINLDQIKQAISAKTKLIVMNQPHNPTGSTLEEEEIQQLWEITQNKNIYLLADEVAIHSKVNTAPETPNLYKALNNIIGIGVCSKSLGLSGLRVGWAIISNPALKKKMVDIKSFLSICTSQVDELILTHTLNQHGTAIIQRNNQILTQNTAYFEALKKSLPELIHWSTPNAGLLSVVTLPQVKSMLNFSKKLITQAGLLILPTQTMGLDGPYFRLGLGKQGLEQHLQAFAQVLKTERDA